MIIKCFSIQTEAAILINKSHGAANTFTVDQGYDIDWLPKLGVAVIKHVGILKDGKRYGTNAVRVVGTPNLRHIRPMQQLQDNGVYKDCEQLDALLKSQNIFKSDEAVELAQIKKTLDSILLHCTSPQESTKYPSQRSPKA